MLASAHPHAAARSAVAPGYFRLSLATRRCMHAGDAVCYDPWKGVNDETQHIASMWDYQWCTEMWMPNGRDGVSDVFWSEPWDAEASKRACMSEWGVQPRRLRATIEWGGRRLDALSNVVFSNGLYDPWHGGGVLEDLSDTVKVWRLTCMNDMHDPRALGSNGFKHMEL